ncbi:MAG: M55 family metallopeptidase [Gemmatimonadota bacterium]|nr:MAG: M55 family metallopeptidase [Gemmatimonadota bacterium]
MRRTRSRIVTVTLGIMLGTGISFGEARCQERPLKIYISVDMEGISGIGTAKMTSVSGKDYEVGRRLMTADVMAVVAAILEGRGSAEFLVNDSHGDMQNLLHTELGPGVQYIQGNTKPLGMVEGLDETFDAAIFVGYHARAGTENAFIAHTGSGSVKGLWINGVEVGEGGLNAYYAGAHGVPVIMATGDSAFTVQISQLLDTRTVVTKVAVGSLVARLYHPNLVHAAIRMTILEALANLSAASPLVTQDPVTVRMRFATTTRPDILQAVPGMRRVDGYTVEYDAADMVEAYKLIRLMYKYISW